MLMPYSQRVPGSVIKGSFSASFLQVVTAGSPVFSRYCTMSPFHIL